MNYLTDYFEGTYVHDFMISVGLGNYNESKNPTNDLSWKLVGKDKGIRAQRFLASVCVVSNMPGH